MMKYILAAGAVVIAILLIYCNSLRTSNHQLQETVNGLSTSVEELSTKLEKTYEENAEIRKQYQSLQEASQLDTVFNWTVDISNSPVVKQLHTN